MSDQFSKYTKYSNGPNSSHNRDRFKTYKQNSLNSSNYRKGGDQIIDNNPSFQKYGLQITGNKEIKHFDFFANELLAQYQQKEAKIIKQRQESYDELMKIIKNNRASQNFDLFQDKNYDFYQQKIQKFSHSKQSKNFQSNEDVQIDKRQMVEILKNFQEKINENINKRYGSLINESQEYRQEVDKLENSQTQNQSSFDQEKIKQNNFREYQRILSFFKNKNPNMFHRLKVLEGQLIQEDPENYLNDLLQNQLEQEELQQNQQLDFLKIEDQNESKDQNTEQYTNLEASIQAIHERWNIQIQQNEILLLKQKGFLSNTIFRYLLSLMISNQYHQSGISQDYYPNTQLFMFPTEFYHTLTSMNKKKEKNDQLQIEKCIKVINNHIKLFYNYLPEKVQKSKITQNPGYLFKYFKFFLIAVLMENKEKYPFQCKALILMDLNSQKFFLFDNQQTFKDMEQDDEASAINNPLFKDLKQLNMLGLNPQRTKNSIDEMFDICEDLMRNKLQQAREKAKQEFPQFARIKNKTAKDFIRDATLAHVHLLDIDLMTPIFRFMESIQNQAFQIEFKQQAAPSVRYPNREGEYCPKITGKDREMPVNQIKFSNANQNLQSEESLTGMDHFSDKLSKYKNLEQITLNLGYNAIGSQGILLVGKYILAMRSLNKLWLNVYDNQIYEDGMNEFLHQFSQWPVYKTLKLDFRVNPVSKKNYEVLKNHIKHKKIIDFEILQ